MPLQDVSNDSGVIGWLRQAGHGHLLEQQQQFHNASAPVVSSGGYNSYNQSSSISPPIISSGGYSSGSNIPAYNSYNHSASFSHNNNATIPHIQSSASYSHINDGNIQSYNHSPSPVHYASSSAQFLAPHMNEAQLDAEIETLKHDPNTRVVHRPPGGDVVYKQRVFVKYLQPPTPPVGGTIIVREKQPPAPPPDPPLVIRRAPPPPPTPPPVIIRERPPVIPPPEGTTVIDKIIPPGPKPPRQVIIEQFPQLPPKPQDVIVERWLPVAPRQRRIFYERLPGVNLQPPMPTRPIIIQHGQPNVRIQREITTAPGPQLAYPHQISSGTDINHILSQVGVNQQFPSALSPSSLISYDPYSALNQSYGGSIGLPQSNTIYTQNAQPSILSSLLSSSSSSAYGLPSSYIYAPNQIGGLGMYGSGISTIPSHGYSSGNSTFFDVPEHVPIDSVLRQFGIDSHSLHHSSSFINPSANFVSYATNPQNAVSHVWDAASHASPPQSINPTSAVSHVWNAAAHATDPSHLGLPAVQSSSGGFSPSFPGRR